jgi:hypothetical protein
MISNERHWAAAQRGDGNSYPKPRIAEGVMKTEYLQVERKSFTFTLRENPRGRFLRITEDAGGQHTNILIPASGLEEFVGMVEGMAKEAREIPEGKPQELA